MIETGNVLNNVQYYFGNTSFLVLFIISLLCSCFLIEKQYRRMLLFAVICFLIVYNDVMFMLVERFKGSGEYYRFFWMIPLTTVLAVLAAYCFTKADTGIKKVFVLIILVMVILSSGEGRRIPDMRIQKMDNGYTLPEETMELIQIMDQDRKEASVVVLCPEDLIRYLRIYDGAYISAVPRSIYRSYADFDVSNANANKRRAWLLLDSLQNAEHDSEEVKEALSETEVRYIICSKENNAEDYKAFGGILLGETAQYYIYKLK